MKIHRLVLAACASILAACSNVAVVEHGDALVSDRLSVQIDQPWNRFENSAAGPIPTWTREGFTVDALQFFVAVKDGKPIAPARDKAKPMIFRDGMQAHEIVSLFENFYTQDGSTFKLDRLAPDSFLDGDGFRFEFTRLRKRDDVRLSGVGWAAVSGGELTAIVFTAPRIHFFGAEIGEVERLAGSARLR